ncbi:hypothetical protein PRN20_22065 [Devosia sp. ZB163]|uniref:hypothetical protein n=1 Tax=Devosia sp. ZB163 TaxID=3025938 RepID=UPI0023626FD4|nr:hypothetical protein [Devosia sp. ZB163]MDC9826431.1 hypothetical protein [Devosia sp. ZB163]
MTDNTVFIPPERRAVRGGAFIPPLLIVPLVAYNFFAFLFMGGNPAGWSQQLLTIPMVSGVQWSLTSGDLMLVIGLVCLFFEVIKSTNTGRNSVIEHMLSVVVFVVFLVEFLLVGAAASSVFFILMMMAIVDVVAGFTVSITGAGRDVSMN